VDTNGNSETETMHEDYLRQRILHILSLYPRISPAMMQVALGASIPSRWWRPVLEQMISEGVVVREGRHSEGPGGRERNYTILSLKQHSAARHDVFRHGNTTSLESDDRGPSQLRADAK
jgi:hypothetical protein